MNNSVSDHSFYIESDEEEDAQKEFDKGEGNNNDGNVSDYSDSSADDNPQQNKPSSYNTSWPQSYRFSPLIPLSSSVYVLLPLCLASRISLLFNYFLWFISLNIWVLMCLRLALVGVSFHC
jgi:hypothetical protein